MMILFGIVFVVIAGIIGAFINSNINLGIEYQNIIVNSIVYTVFVIIYYFLILYHQNKNLKKEQQELIEILTKPQSSNKNVDFGILKELFFFVDSFIKEFKEKEKKDNFLIDELKSKIKQFENVINDSDILYITVTDKWNVTNLNQTAKHLFDVKTSYDFNKKFNSLKHIIKNKVSEDLHTLVDKEVELNILDKYYLCFVTEVEVNSFLIKMVDISKLKKENEKLKNTVYQIHDNLFTDKKIDKFTKTTFIRILNYDRYAAYLDDTILKRFENSFVEILVKNGYSEIFKIGRDIYAVYDYADINYLKNELETEIVVEVVNNKFILNPIVIFGAGINYEKAKQQLFESSLSLKSAIKENIKYPFSYINFINCSILDDDISFSYRQVKDKIMIEPYLKSTELTNGDISSYLRDFNLYLRVIHKIFVKYLSIFENQKVIINLDSSDLINSVSLGLFLKFIINNQLDVIFNVNINTHYEFSYALLKEIKIYLKIGLRNIGRGYFDFRTVYDLRVNYMEVDEKLIEYIKENPEAKKFLDGLKLITRNRKTELIAMGYKDENILEIGEKKII
jgi:heme/copper-type cytochrome/quinol oxidase subunit 2